MATRGRERSFRYGRTYFVQRFAGLAALFVALLLILGLQFSTPSVWVAAIGVFAAVYVLVFGLSPLLTSHALVGSRLVIRQGWYFRFPVSLRTVERIAPFEGPAPLGLRVRLGQDLLFVAGSAHGLVEISLPRPRRFWQVLGARAGRLVFDVERREAFLQAVAERRSLSPVQAKRAYPELRD